MNAAQRAGVIFLVFLIVFLAVAKKPIFDYIQKINYSGNAKFYLKELQDFDYQNNTQTKAETSKNYNKKYPSTTLPKNTIHLNINEATELQYKELYGIGDILAKRIVTFRTKLGGFHSTEQLKEVYGLTPETYNEIRSQLFVPQNFTIDKININTATIEELDNHPYISSKLASQIVKYRDKAGLYSDISQLQKMYAMNDTLYQKLSPYLTIH